MRPGTVVSSRLGFLVCVSSPVELDGRLAELAREDGEVVMCLWMCW